MTEASDIVESQKSCDLLENGIIFKRGLTFREWEKQGEAFTKVIRIFNEHIRWWLGDWIIAGESQFPEKYSQALEDTMYTIGTLRNCTYVCRNVPLANRNPKLSFDHHYEVAKLAEDKQRDFLADAEVRKWTVRELRMAVAGDPDPKTKCVPDRMPSGNDKAEALNICDAVIKYAADNGSGWLESKMKRMKILLGSK